MAATLPLTNSSCICKPQTGFEPSCLTLHVSVFFPSPAGSLSKTVLLSSETQRQRDKRKEILYIPKKDFQCSHFKQTIHAPMASENSRSRNVSRVNKGMETVHTNTHQTVSLLFISQGTQASAAEAGTREPARPPRKAELRAPAQSPGEPRLSKRRFESGRRLKRRLRCNLRGGAGPHNKRRASGALRESDPARVPAAPVPCAPRLRSPGGAHGPALMHSVQAKAGQWRGRPWDLGAAG